MVQWTLFNFVMNYFETVLIIDVMHSKKSSLFYSIVTVLTFVFLLLIADVVIAQCPMCKASAESSLAGGSTMAKGLNKGILYLLMMPYIIFSVLFGLWYYYYKQKKVVVK